MGDTVDGDQYDSAIRSLGFTQVSFADHVGIGQRTSRTYASKGPPEPIRILIALMESIHVPGGWRGNRIKDAPTVEETKKAVAQGIHTIVAKAVEQHWDPLTIADALVEIAGDIRKAQVTRAESHDTSGLLQGPRL